MLCLPNGQPGESLHHYPHDEFDGIHSEMEMMDAYGFLYNWFAINTSKLCPEGWRMPDKEDWEQLEAFLVDEFEDITEEGAANALKSCRQINSPLGGDSDTSVHPRWISQEIYRTDNFGFSAYPAGYRHPGGSFL